MSTTLQDKYEKWDKLAPSLVSEVKEEEEKERNESSEALGHSRTPYSQAEADEKAKLELAMNAKKTMDAQKEKMSNAIATLDNLIVKNETKTDDGDDTSVMITEEQLGEKRVVTLCNCKGPGVIVFPAQLSNLVCESKVSDTNKEKESSVISVKGLIKIFIEDCHDCVIKLECKLITSTIEISKSTKVTLEISKEKISTIQADLCEELTIKFMDENLFEAKTKSNSRGDMIFHAGVKQSDIIIYKNNNGDILTQTTVDYVSDGAVAVGNASAEEYQFVTFLTATPDKNLRTERLIRYKGQSLTQSEFDAKHNPDKKTSENKDSLSENEIKDMIDQCFKHKLDGNDEFKAGNYAQAILFYSMAIDKAKSLSSTTSQSFPESHICHANRSACFLKLGRHQEALDDAEACIALDATFIKGKFRKGLALHAMQKYHEALPVLGECLKIEPQNKQIQQAVKFCEMRVELDRRARYGR